MVFYQPLIGYEAVSLYLTLVAEAKNPGNSNIQRLLSLTTLQIKQFEEALAFLQEYFLLKVFVQEKEEFNVYIYQLHAPRNSQSFIDDVVYMTKYLRTVGQLECQTSIQNLGSRMMDKSKYRDITLPVKNVMSDVSNPVVYSNIKPISRFNDNDEIDFDYDRFLAITSTGVFPSQFRNHDNMELIGRLATIYDISPERMVTLVRHSMDYENKVFKVETLRSKAKLEKHEPIEMNKVKDVYELAPVLFLQSKQEGIEVSNIDKRLLEHLSVDYHMSNEIINILIEYVLKISDNRLAYNFVDSVASTWIRNGVKTREDAKKQIQETNRQVRVNNRIRGYNKVVQSSDYMQRQKEGKTPELHKPSDELYQKAMETFNKKDE